MADLNEHARRKVEEDMRNQRRAFDEQAARQMSYQQRQAYEAAWKAKQ